MIDWDHQYQIEETPWEKGAPAPPLLDWIAAHPDEISGRLMAPGCGLGHDVRALAAAYPNSEIVGLDISRLALDRAAEFPRVGKERYRLGDLFDLPEGMLLAFDWVFEHTCFCAIDPEKRDNYVQSVAVSLKRGGTLLGVFFLDPYDDEHRPGGGPPHGCTEAELEQRFAGSGKFEILDSYVPENAFEGREGRELVMRMRKG